MSYDVVIEQVKALPEQLLTSVSTFIKLSGKINSVVDNIKLMIE